RARRLPGQARAAVRVLHAGDGDGRGVAPGRESVAHRRSSARRAGRQLVPVHRLPQHRRGSSRGGEMIPAPFDYVRADSADAALASLGEHGDEAKLLAGGQSLLPLMKLRLATPAVVVDVSRLRDLAYVREDGDVLAIGALTRHCDVAASPAVVAH